MGERVSECHSSAYLNTLSRPVPRRPAGQPPKAAPEEPPTRGVADECDHSDDTPVINTSLWEERKARGEGRLKGKSLKDDPNDHEKNEDDQQQQQNGDEPRAWNGAPADQSVLDTTSIGSDHSAERLRTSTPAGAGAGRSSSLQHLELSNVADEDFHFASQKKKPKSRGLKSMGATLRSSFRKGLNQNHDPPASPALQRAAAAADTNSIRSETSEMSYSASPFDEDDERARHNQTLGDEGKSKSKSKLQRSLSSLSIASITKRSMSMRLASSKATEVFRRIGSMKERGYKKGSYSLEDAASSGKLSRQGLDDDVSHKSYTGDHNTFDEHEHDLDDTADGDGPQKESPEAEAEAETESPRLERVLAASSITVPRSIFTKWKDQRTLRAFRNLRDRSNSSKKAMEEDSEGWSPENGRASPVADNPDGIREYLASIGKANLKADLLGHVKIPIKVTWSAYEMSIRGTRTTVYSLTHSLINLLAQPKTIIILNGISSSLCISYRLCFHCVHSCI